MYRCVRICVLWLMFPQTTETVSQRRRETVGHACFVCFAMVLLGLASTFGGISLGTSFSKQVLQLSALAHWVWNKGYAHGFSPSGDRPEVLDCMRIVGQNN